jgi:serine/threonine-protein kinase
MGAVVAAQHLQLDARVAIKFLLPAMLENRDAVTRFANEARRAARIKSDHVARVHDVGNLEDGTPFIVMEYLEGADLRAVLRERGTLAVEEAVDFVVQAMEAIAEAHTLGIVHCDIKPANLFCTRRPDGKLWIKVLDFGISRAFAPGFSLDFAVSGGASPVGSPLYMAPEQLESSRGADARTDIWALGVVLFELLTGKVPFEGTTLPEVCAKIALHPSPPPRQYRPDAAEGLECAILRCLEKDRARRYPNVAELAGALAPFASNGTRAIVERITDTLRVAGLTVTSRRPAS